MNVGLIIVDHGSHSRESNQLLQAVADRFAETYADISTRFPGFNAYAMLRDGDVLISVVGSNVQITGLDDLPSALAGKEPGTTIELEVQRAGQLLRVPVRLSPRPLFLNNRNQAENSATFSVEREEAASKYWEANFAKLLDQQTM